MKQSKRFLPALGLMLILAGSAFSQDRKSAVASTRGARNLQMLRLEKLQFLKNHNLSPDQKAQIKSILENQKNRVLISARDLVKARLDLANNAPGAEIELEQARIAAARLKAEILEQVKPALNSDQLSTLHQRMQRKAQRLQRLLDRLNAKING
jgi:hypothetical protein